MTLNIYTDDSSPMSTSDVESFTGKIVCNIDGSSYIIDAENATLSSLNDNSLSVAAISVTNEKTLQTTKISTTSGINLTATTATSNTTSSETSKAFFNEGLDQAQKQQQQQQSVNPKIHTFRVVSANDANIQLRQENNLFKIQKPILMCFICKLSFGITKSFSLHANTEHGLDLQELEKHLLMQREYSSAIIQRNMDESPQISFLEPVDVDTSAQHQQQQPLISSSTAEEFSGMESQDNELANTQQSVVISTGTSNINSSVSSLSSSSSTSSSTLLSPSCTNNSTLTTSTTTTTTPREMPQIISSPHDEEHQSYSSMNDSTTSTTSSAVSTTTTITTPTLSSLSLHKSKTNNYNINESVTSDNLTTNTATSTITVTSSSSCPIAKNISPTPTTTKSAIPFSTTPHSSSLSLTTGVDLSTSTGNLATEAISTDSLVNLNKLNNDNSNHNDSIEPQTHDIITAHTHTSLSPKSHHITPSHQSTAASLNTNMMSDFLQQHLQRLTTERIAADEDSQHKNMDNDNLSWSQPSANTFPTPATAANSSVAQISSLHASLAALNSEQNSSSVKLISKFLQHQLVAAQQQQQQHQKQLSSHSLNHAEAFMNQPNVSTSTTSSMHNVCPEHPDFKGIDCKTCEMLDAPQNFKPSPQVTPQRSPTNSGIAAAAAAAAAAAGLGLLTAANKLSMSPNHSLNVNTLPSGLNVPLNTPPLNNPAASFTIGACSDHINGRPLGVECARCEMILNSARLNSNVQMSTRNSCKTLKCPQCNWHYKYQETLEIHMREKHPDGESACGYCLAGQQHPRLARGESYSCGYKPYRCEICNYSTTTKGNLSIHMQSDKHLNNMQELNSSQNMVAAAVAAATGGSVGKLDSTPKINLSATMGNLASQQQQQHQQQQQQQQSQLSLVNVSNSSNISSSSCGISSTSLPTSNVSNVGASSSSSNKPKPSFRCDICSYETSVARNLRIHMTSEKHTHNMAVLQNNIKHIQALTFLQQQQQQQQQSQQQQHQGNNFMPEVALADLAYNQALMIQLLHQNAAAAAAQTQTQGQSPLACGSPALIPTNKIGIKLQSNSPPTSSELPSSPYSPKSNDLSSTDPTTGNMEPPIKPDMWPTTLFSCLICANFNTNNLDELNQHLMIDRSRQTTPSSSTTRSLSPTGNNHPICSNNTSSGSVYFSDIMVFQNNNYICRLCNYKTNLKANYQLHSKTDKHLQKLNFINHLREGGAANEYKLKYYQQQQQQIGANTVQIKCNCCDFYTNSIQKLSLHTQHMRHETMIMIFQHLNYLVQQQQTTNSCSNEDSPTNPSIETAPISLVDGSTPTSSSASTSAATAAKPESAVSCHKSLLCHLCNFKAYSLLEMIQHVKSIRHLQVEQFVCLQRRSEQLETPSLDDVFKLCNNNTSTTTPNTTPTHTSNINISINDNKTASSSAACFTNFIESENEDYSNKMFFEQNDESENNTNLDSMGNLTSSAGSAHQQENSNKPMDTTEESANTTPSSIPTLIYKCSSCDFFGQAKQEVEAHIVATHPNSDSCDVISIPTNPVAIQAFQAAMAAATLAAVSRVSKTPHSLSPTASPGLEITKDDTHDNEDVLEPVAVKRERLDIPETETLPEDSLTTINEPSTSMEVVEQNEPFDQSKPSNGVQCPLCQDYFTEKQALEMHLMTIHSVNRDGLARLLLLVDTSIWQNEETTMTNRSQSMATEPASSSTKSDTSKTATKPSLSGYELLLCQQCGSGFKHEQQLLQHAQKMQHYTMQKGEYLCLAFNSVRNPCKMHYPTLTAMFNHYNDTHMRLVISERHVYKYRCKQCSLAFKTQEKLATHTLYHTMRDATKCAMCQRNFRSTQALQKHMEQAHNQTNVTANNLECPSPRTVSPSGSEIERHAPETTRTCASDKFENESNRSVTPGQEICPPTQSPSLTHNEPQNPQSPATQQQMSTITALINQQQNANSSELLHHLQMQHQQFQNLPALHNLQQMQQQLPQFAAAAAASGMPINPVEMLNLMQFHHLISLNFMNLAPPLIFGGNAAAAASTVPSNTTTPTNLSNNSAAQPPSNMSSSTEISGPTSSTANPNIAPTTAPTLPNVDVSTQILQQQQQISPGTSNSQLLNNQKRARTRITDDQLKILRAHFDINNSPSEESILEMSQKANLPMKVVKHWFRNTLFKERQRNKDSPYNFNNPPSTTLNLEEYERTGQAKVMPLTDQIQQQQLQIPSRPSSAHSISNISEYSNQQPQQQQLDHKHREEADNLRSQASSVASSTFPLDVQIKTEPGEDLSIANTISVDSPGATAMSTFLKQQQQQHQKLRFSNLEQDHDMMIMSDQHMSSTSAQQQQQAVAAATFYNSYETKSESESSDMHSRPHTPNSNTTSNLYASMNDLLSQQLENMPLNQMGPPKKFQINPNSNPCSNINTTTNDRSTTHTQIGTTSSGSNVMCGSGTGGITVSSKLFEKHSPSAQYDTNSNSSNSSTTSSGKRANRTRFTDYQIKVLQEFFENNSYPKDSDLEYLSKLLLLSPRVIVVWFQNARQKQRKIYENQPNNSLYESEEKKQNINYACKKCSLVFQRYYELIRHQKNHCFKEENNKKSAKAQIAAAQIAQNLSSEDSNSSMDINSAAAAALLAQHHPVAAVVAGGGVGKNTPTNREFSPIANNANTPPRDQSSSNNNDHQKFSCDKCKLSFNNFDHLREHQLMHLVNPNLRLTTEAHTSASAAAAVAAYGPFGSILQSLQQAAHLQQTVASTTGSQPVAKKRKYSETSSNADDVSSQGGFSLTGADYDSHAKKYNFLYQYFLQNEGNSELRQQFHNQDSAELNMEFLANYYQQTELKKRNNYEFLFQYYIRNEQQTNANFELADNKPNIEFLLQYYQLCESKKFFQLEASPQRIHDGPLIQGAIDTTQHNINSSNNSSSRPASNGSDRSSSSPGVSGINEESNGGGVVNNMENENSPLLTTYNNDLTTRSNGQHCNKNNNNNNTDLMSSNVELNNHKSDGLNCTNDNKIEEQMDQLDGLQEVKNQANPIQSTVNSLNTTTDSETNAIAETTGSLGNYYQNLEDFLDATMIENHNQTLTFPSELSELTDNPKQQKSLLTTNTIPTEDTVPTASNSAENNHKQANKRLRTTILPEQLNFLYECYQNESNPSRKMLEEIAKKVSLKKRVVQVWFQNTRAKDKKSRNQQRQHFSNISDDNSNSSSVTNNNLKATIPAGLTSIKSAVIGGEASSNDVIRDCNLCQVTQVNIQQHAFTVDHISKVKELLAQTTAAAAASMMQESVEDDDEKYSLNDYRQKLAPNNGEQNMHQQQLALMMMAFQTQNIPNSLITFNAQDDNSVQFEGTDEKSGNDIPSKLPSKNQKKTKRTAIKKKKNTIKKSMAENLAADNELFFNFNANMADTTHLNAATEIRPEDNDKNDTLGLDSNDENDGNNNVEDIEMTEDEDAELKNENTNNIENQCESITETNDITKSQIYNYNHIAVMEGK